MRERKRKRKRESLTKYCPLTHVRSSREIIKDNDPQTLEAGINIAFFPFYLALKLVNI